MANPGIFERARGHRAQSTFNEKELILNRAGYFSLDLDRIETMTICPKHRKDLTVDWPGRKRTTCSHPNHQAGGIRKQSNIPRRINVVMSEEIFAIYHNVVPVGSGEYI